MSQKITLRQWTDVVRRARLGRTVKAVAMVLATYADADGTRVFPGIARLSYECEIGYNVTQNALAKLRDVQLIELVNRSKRRGTADEYRLILGAELLERIEVPTPAQVELAINRIRNAKHRQPKPAVHPTALGTEEADADDLHPTPLGVEDPETAEVHPTGLGVDEARTPNGVGSKPASTPNGVGRVHPTPLGATTHYLDTTTTAHSGEEVLTTSHPPRAGAAESNPDLPSADVIDLDARRVTLSPARCAHGLKAGNRADGQPHCALCRKVPGLVEAFIPNPRGAPA